MPAFAFTAFDISGINSMDTPQDTTFEPSESTVERKPRCIPASTYSAKISITNRSIKFIRYLRNPLCLQRETYAENAFYLSIILYCIFLILASGNTFT